MPLVSRNQKITLGIYTMVFITLTFKTMEEILNKKYERLQDDNLNLMVEHLNKPKGSPYSKEIITNIVLMTKIGQMISQMKTIAMSNY